MFPSIVVTGQLCLYVHFKFSDEGIFGNADMELYFLWLLHAICHAARDDGDGIATGHGGVYVVAVNVPVILKIEGMLENKKKGPRLLGWHQGEQRSDDGGRHHRVLIGVTTDTPHSVFSLLFSNEPHDNKVIAQSCLQIMTD